MVVLGERVYIMGEAPLLSSGDKFHLHEFVLVNGCPCLIKVS